MSLPGDSPMTNPASDRRRIAISIIGTLLGVASIVAILGLMLYVGQPAVSIVQGQKTPEERSATLRELREADQKAITSYGWVDQGKGIVRIPVDVAMDKLVQEYRVELWEKQLPQKTP